MNENVITQNGKCGQALFCALLWIPGFLAYLPFSPELQCSRIVQSYREICVQHSCQVFHCRPWTRLFRSDDSWSVCWLVLSRTRRARTSRVPDLCDFQREDALQFSVSWFAKCILHISWWHLTESGRSPVWCIERVYADLSAFSFQIQRSCCCSIISLEIHAWTRSINVRQQRISSTVCPYITKI